MTSAEFREKYSKKLHLGDGLFVHFDGWHLVLTAPRETEDHYVCLEPDVFETLIEYREKLLSDSKKINGVK